MIYQIKKIFLFLVFFLNIVWYFLINNSQYCVNNSQYFCFDTMIPIYCKLYKYANRNIKSYVKKICSRNRKAISKSINHTIKIAILRFKTLSCDWSICLRLTVTTKIFLRVMAFRDTYASVCAANESKFREKSDGR